MAGLEGRKFRVNDSRSELDTKIVTIDYADGEYVFYSLEDGQKFETTIAHLIYRISQRIWIAIK
jgi:hypothetical protein